MKIKEITVVFGRAKIRPDGELVFMTIDQYDSRITLTKEQADSLSQIISQRLYGEKKDG